MNSVYLSDELLTKEKWDLLAINNLSFPSISQVSVGRGSFLGQKIGIGNFQSYRFGTEWKIVGSDISDLATQREDFIGLLGEIIADGGKTLKFNKSNGINVQLDVKGVRISGDLKANTPHSSVLLIDLETEYPFLMSQTLQEVIVNIYTGGGFSVPFGVPFTMAEGGSNDVTIVNGGNYKAYPIYTFYGILDTPTFVNYSNGETLSINYSLDSTDKYIEIDTYNRTAVLYPSGQNIKQYVSGDFATLAKGDNLIHLGSASYNETGKVKVAFRDHYLNI